MTQEEDKVPSLSACLLDDPSEREGMTVQQRGRADTEVDIHRGTPDLRTIYRNLYDVLPWPEPIPRPEEVTFRWGRVHTGRLGACAPEHKIIMINRLYRDERLRTALAGVLAHEASHFIWPTHSRGFREFLRQAGVAEPYRRARAPLSELFQRVKAEWLERHVRYGSLQPRHVAQIEFPFDD